MPPSPDRLGPYEIATPIGAGGMGEVYRARDTKLVLKPDAAGQVLEAGISAQRIEHGVYL